MKIVTNRNILLSGKHYAAGKPTDAAEEDAALAIRHGWAEPAPAKVKKAAEQKPGEQAGE